MENLIQNSKGANKVFFQTELKDSDLFFLLYQLYFLFVDILSRSFQY